MQQASLFKKRASYLSLLLLALPLVVQAQAAALPAIDPAAALASGQLSRCGPPASLDSAAVERLQAFYRQLPAGPLWNPQRRSQLHEAITALADDGLQPDDYPQPAPLQQADPAEQLCAELLTSHSYLQAIRHLSGGRLSQQRFEPLWRSPQLERSPRVHAAVQIAARHVDSPASAMAEARPPLAQYQALRRAYAEARRQPLPDWPVIADGRPLKPGSQDPRVPGLRLRLQIEGDAAPASAAQDAADHHYDQALSEALRAFQRRHNLQDDGILGPYTLDELNLPPRLRRDQLLVNLERLRWLADDWLASRVLVNVAGAELLVLEQGREVWRTRSQVGRPQRKTPLLVSQIDRLTLNPSWTVPPTIFRQDKLPAIRKNPGFLADNQLQVIGSDGRRIDPAQVDWNNPGAIRLRQPPGARNPLGHLALRFANPFAVYLHDTPSQALFDRSPRVFSSGCVRVEAIDNLLEWLLPADELQQVRQRLPSGHSEEFRPAQPIPLLLAYWTVEVAADGQLRYSPDLYDRDLPLLRALLAASP